MLEKFKDISVLKIGPTSVGQVLYFLGVRHTNNIANMQFNQLEQFWNEFLKISKSERIVFTESIIRATLPSYEDSIKERGEAGAAQWLANKNDVICICLDPNDEEQRKAFCVSFDSQIVAYALIAQNLAAWYRHSCQSTFDEAVNRSVNREVKFSDIYGFTPNNLWFLDQHKKLFGEQKLEDRNFLDSISDPRKNDTVVNNIVSFRTKIRNEYILSEINKAWEIGKSIFVVYGSGHLIALEDSLRKIK